MKTTTALLAATAAAFLFTGMPTMAADTDTKRCYRTVHKLPYRLRVPCPDKQVKMEKPPAPTPAEPKEPEQPPPEKKP